MTYSPRRPLEKELRDLLYEDRLILRLSRIALDAYSAGFVDTADALNRACDCLGLALDQLGPNRRRKPGPEDNTCPGMISDPT
jgi:hypothetical protein